MLTRTEVIDVREFVSVAALTSTARKRTVAAMAFTPAAKTLGDACPAVTHALFERVDATSLWTLV